MMRKVLKRTKKTSDVEVVYVNDLPKKHTCMFLDQILGEEKVTVNGRLQKRTVFKDYDTHKELSKYKVSDFDLENLAVTGALDGMSVVKFNDNNIDSTLKIMDAMVDEMDNNAK